MAVVLALLAAIFYAINTPFSKILLNQIPPTMMAAFLYLGAGIGVGFLYLFHVKGEDKSERLTRKDFPYTIGMIAVSYTHLVAEQVNIHMKYDGYIQRQMRQVEQFQKLENKKLPENLDYNEVPSLRTEARQKLTAVRPLSIGCLLYTSRCV